MGLNDLGSKFSKAGSTIKSTAIRSAQTLKMEQQISTMQHEILDAYRLLGIQAFETEGEIPEESFELLCGKINENEEKIQQLREEIQTLNGKQPDALMPGNTQEVAVKVTFESAWGKEQANLLLKDGMQKPKTAVTKRAVKAIRNMMVQGENVQPLDIFEQENTSLDIDIRDRTVSNNGKPRQLLKDIRLNIQKGELVLVLGGSGAGKTTFFNAVMGSEKANATIKFGNIDFYQNFERLKHIIGYVPQNDPLRLDDTVWQTLRNVAELRLPTQEIQDKEMLNARIQEVLAMMNLEKEADNTVGKLSGGQKKRLSIAGEYIANPFVFFLDEPDSGLDGNQARILMNNLRSIADTGRIVLVISHSPDRVAELFDKVIVLAKSNIDNCGRLAFYGEPSEAVRFFDVESIEGIVAKIDADGSQADEFIQRFEEMQSEKSNINENGEV